MRLVDYITDITIDDIKDILQYFQEEMTSVFIVKKNK